MKWSDSRTVKGNSGSERPDHSYDVVGCIKSYTLHAKAFINLSRLQTVAHESRLRGANSIDKISVLTARARYSQASFARVAC